MVNKDGTPGEGFIEASSDEIGKKREDVFAYDWFNLFPPTVEELAEAYERGRNE